MKTHANKLLTIITVLFIILTLISLVIFSRASEYSYINTKLTSLNIYDYPNTKLFVGNDTIETMNELYTIKNSEYKLKYENLEQQIELAGITVDLNNLTNNYYIDSIYLDNILKQTLGDYVSLGYEKGIDVDSIINNKRLNDGEKIIAISEQTKTIITGATPEPPKTQTVNDIVVAVNNDEVIEANEDGTCSSNYPSKKGSCPDNQGYYQKKIEYETTCQMIGGDWNNQFSACFTIDEDYSLPVCGEYTFDQAQNKIKNTFVNEVIDTKTYTDEPIDCKVYRFILSDGTIVDVSDTGVIYR